MICEKPRSTALAAGSTVAILYSTCALAFALFPSLAAGFINAVNHGVNLQALQVGEVSFTFGGFLIGLICITLYAMVAGYIYGAIRNGLRKAEGEQVEIRKRSPAHA